MGLFNKAEDVHVPHQKLQGLDDVGESCTLEVRGQELQHPHEIREPSGLDKRTLSSVHGKSRRCVPSNKSRKSEVSSDEQRDTNRRQEVGENKEAKRK